MTRRGRRIQSAISSIPFGHKNDGEESGEEEQEPEVQKMPEIY